MSAVAIDFRERGVPTSNGAQWCRTTVVTLLRNPRLAGIRSYGGSTHERKVKINDWRNRAVRIDGEYVMTDIEPLLSVEQWEALQMALDNGGRTGVTEESAWTGTGRNNVKHLLTGLVHCGRCDCKMVGRKAHGRQMYGCRPKDMGGCNSVSRNVAKLDALIVKLAVAQLEKIAPIGVVPAKGPKPLDELAALADRKVALRERWVAGDIDDDDY